MNIEKAREYFSAYYEETLERGLRQSFEQKLRSDSELREEYESFKRTMSELDELKYEDIPVPLYLNARIMSRLSEATEAQKPSRGIVYYLPRFGIAAAAAAAIVATVISIPRFGSTGNSESSILPGVGSQSPGQWPSEKVSVKTDRKNPNSPDLYYVSAVARTVNIIARGLSSGITDQSFPLTVNQPLDARLTNPNPGAVAFHVQISGGGPDELVVVPGSSAKNGSQPRTGSLLDLALALADQYRAPVIIEASNPDATVTWNLQGTSAKDALDKSLDGTDFQEIQTASGVLSIRDRGL